MEWVDLTLLGMQLIGLGVKQYFQDGWNVFDFTVVAGSLVDIFFSFITTK